MQYAIIHYICSSNRGMLHRQGRTAGGNSTLLQLIPHLLFCLKKAPSADLIIKQKLVAVL